MYYAVGDNSKFYTSADGGNTWAVSILPYAGNYVGIEFFDANTGFVCGYDTVASGDAQPIILKTIDGGISWAKMTTPTGFLGGAPYQLYCIRFIDSNIGYCAGYITDLPAMSKPQILKTVNGGTNWAFVELNSESFKCTDMKVDSDNTLLLFGYNFFHSTASIFRYDGATFTLINDGLSSGDTIMYRVSKTGANQLRMANFEGKLAKSEDDGTTVTYTNIDLTTECRSVFFTDSNTGHIGTANGKMFRQDVNSPIPRQQTYGGGAIYDIYMESEQYGVAVGAGGSIYKYQV